jgi:predicted alpha/beta superfamily hydrolase
MRCILLLFIFNMVALPGLASEPVVIGEKHILASKILDEDRPYFIRLPKSYNDDKYLQKRYPVLYILDGEAHFLSTVGVIDHMSGGLNGNIQIPELIVVAIANTDDRMRDMSPTHTKIDFRGKEQAAYATSGGGDEFLQFIEKELMPVIEKKYRTASHRTLVGHSLGGLITLHSFLTRPGLFQNYIAIDSSLWWDNYMMNSRVQTFVEGSTDLKAHVFMSIGGHKTTNTLFDSGTTMLLSNLRFAEWLEKNKSPELFAKFQQFPAENHGSVPLLSLYYGLLHGLGGYGPGLEVYMSGANAVSEHFNAYSDTHGMKFLPPESQIDQFADIAALYSTTDVVRGLLKLNTKNYPASDHAKKRLKEFQSKGGVK